MTKDCPHFIIFKCFKKLLLVVPSNHQDLLLDPLLSLLQDSDELHVSSTPPLTRHPLFSWTPELDFLAPSRLYLGAIFEIFHGSPPSSLNQLLNLLLFPCFREPQSNICSLKILGHISSSYRSPLFLFSFTLTLSPLHPFLLVWSSHLLFKQSFSLSQLAFVIWLEN